MRVKTNDASADDATTTWSANWASQMLQIKFKIYEYVNFSARK